MSADTDTQPESRSVSPISKKQGVISKVVVLLCAALLPHFTIPTIALAQGVDELNVKAAFILNFLKFSELPSRSQGSLQVCVYHDQAAYQAALLLNGKKVGERAVTVSLAQKETGLERCDAIFVPESAAEHSKAVISAVKGQPVLTIGDDLAFVKDGGMIAFVYENDKIRFGISPANSSAVGIGFSAKLLSLGVDIED